MTGSDLATAAGTFFALSSMVAGGVLRVLRVIKAHEREAKAFFLSVDTMFHAVEAQFPDVEALKKVDLALERLKPYMTSANLRVTEDRLTMARDLLWAAHGRAAAPTGAIRSLVAVPARESVPLDIDAIAALVAAKLPQPVVSLTPGQEEALVAKALEAFHGLFQPRERP